LLLSEKQIHLQDAATVLTEVQDTQDLIQLFLESLTSTEQVLWIY
jgi:hypothetical protein